MNKGVSQVLNDLRDERVRLAVSLREAYGILRDNRSISLVQTIIKRDVEAYIATCTKIEELEQMRCELETFFNNTGNSKVLDISNYSRKGKEFSDGN